MVVAISAFLVSLFGIVVLFSVKYREAKTGHTYFPSFRDASDEKALVIKKVLLRTRVMIERLPPIVLLVIRFYVRVLALKFASFLKYGENQAHRLADIVSYKHRFERRETRSEFLRQVSDHKNGGAMRDTVVPEPDEIVG
jgi:hypothetical protein